MPPKRSTAAAAASSSSSSAKKKNSAASSSSSVKKATSGKSSSSESKKKNATTSNKKRKARDEDDDEDEDDAKEALSSATAAPSSKKPASKKVKATSVTPASASSSSSGGITFPVKRNFDWIAALKSAGDLPTAISICLASCPSMSINVKHAIKRHAPHIDLASFQAVLNKMIKDGTVIKYEYNPGGGPRSTEYHLTVQLKCRDCDSIDPKVSQKCYNCALSYCNECRKKFPKNEWSWICNTCTAEGHSL